MRLFLRILSFLFIISLGGILFFKSFDVFSTTTNFWNVGYHSKPYDTTHIDLTTKYGDCIKVTSNNPYESFISTYSYSGWTSFKNDTPPGLTYSPCIPGEWVNTTGKSFYNGNGDREFAFIYGPSFVRDSDGNFYFIMSRLGTQIKKFTSTGTWLMTIGSGIRGENELSGTSAQLSGSLYAGDDYIGNPAYITTDDEKSIYYAYRVKVKKYTSTGQYLFTLGSNTTGDNNLSGTAALFRNIRGISYGTGGRIYVYDQGGRIIKTYDKNGNYILSLGHNYWYNTLSGTGAGLSLGGNTRTTASGDILVFGLNEDGTTIIRKYSSTGGFLGDFSMNGFPNKFNVSSDQVVYAFGTSRDLTSYQMTRLSLTGNILTEFGGTGNISYTSTGGPYGGFDSTYLVDGSGALISKAQGLGVVRKYDKDGNWVMTLGSGVSLNSYYMGDWTGDNNLSGTAALLFVPRLLNTDNRDNSIFLLNGACWSGFGTGNCTIKKYSSTGAWMMTLGGTVGDNNLSGESAGFTFPLVYDPNGSTNPNFFIDSDGSFWIDDVYSYKLKKYSSTGSWLVTIGSTSGDNNLSGESAQNSYPIIADMDSSGNIYVQNNCKLKKYSPTGAWMMTLGSTCGINNLSGESAQISSTWNWNLSANDIHFQRDEQNNMYFVMNPNIDIWGNYNGPQIIKKYSSTGAYMMTIGSGVNGDNNLSGDSAQLGYLWNDVIKIIIQSDQSILVEDIVNKKIKKYSSTGAWLMTIGSTWETNSTSGTGAFIFGANYIDTNARGDILVPTGGNSVAVYTSTGAFTTAIGTSNSYTSNGQLDNTLSGTGAGFYIFTNPVLDDAGSVWVVNVEADKIKKYSSTGAFLFNIGSTDGDNALSLDSAQISPTYMYSYEYPHAPLTVNPDYSITYYDAGNSKVKKYTSSGIYISQYTPAFPSGVGGGRFITDYDGGEVVVPTGDMWGIGFYARAYLFSSGGDYNGFIGSERPGYSNQLSLENAYLSPGNVSIDAKGNTWINYVGDNYSPQYISGSIVKYSATGGYLMTFSGGTTKTPYTFDRFGNLYQYDTETEHMKKYNSTGATVLDIALSYPPLFVTNIMVDTDENILISYGPWVGAYASMHKIFDRNGSMLTTIGSEIQGNNNLSGTSALIESTSVIGFRDGVVTLIDTGFSSCRIIKYDYSGTFLSSIGSNCTTPDNTLDGSAASIYYPSANINYYGSYLDYSGSVYIMRYDNAGYPNLYSTKKYSSTGAYLYSFDFGSGSSSIGFAFNAQNQILAYNGNIETLTMYASTGTNAIFSFTGQVFGNTLFDKYDNFFIAGSDNRIRKYSSTGALISILGDGNSIYNNLSSTGAGFPTNYNLFLDDYGYLYVVTDEKVQRYFP